MNHNIKVSILMPIYKVEQYLEKTLNSIFTQTYQNIDYVFVNDCSPDNSLQVLKDTIGKYGIDESRYTIINHDQNEGIAVSRADSIANAKGDYVLFVDSDDWIEPDMVQTLLDATDNGEIDIIGSDIAGDHLDGKVTCHHEKYGKTCRENLIKCLNYDINTVLWKLLIRRSLFDNFTITPHVDIVEDYIISVKLYYYAKSFKAVPQAMYHYVQYNQARVSLQKLRSINMHILGVKEVEAFCREKGIYDELIEEKLLLRKFNIKSNFLTKQLLDFDTYKSVFPEANRVWRKIPYLRKEKIKFWLAEKGLFRTLELFL